MANLNFDYTDINPIKDIKYSGIHPFEKKELIKRVNTAIENFNIYWRKYIPDLINNKIGYMFENFNDDKKLGEAADKLMDVAKNEGLSINKENKEDKEDIEKALKEGKINITRKSIEEIFENLSTFYRKEFQKFIKNFIKDGKTKLYKSVDKKSGNKVYKGGKFEQLDNQLKELDTILGVIKYNGRVVGIKTCDVTNGINKSIAEILSKELKPYHRAGKKKLENFS